MLFVAGAVAVLVSVVAATSLGASEAADRARVGQRRWVITDLGTLPGGKESEAAAINARQVVGWSRDASGKMRAVRWQGGRPFDLGTPTGRSSAATAVNGRGQVVGWVYVKNTLNKTYEKRPFRRETNGRLSIADLWSGYYVASAINDRGQALVNREPLAMIPTFDARLWQGQKLTDLGSAEATALNDHDQVVGWSRGSLDPPRPSLWQRGKLVGLRTLPGRPDGEATAINERGQIIGSNWKGGLATQAERAFQWQQGKLTDLGTLGGKESRAVAINERGLIVGESETKTGSWHAFLGQNGKLIDLNTARRNEWSPVAINERGQIIGNLYVPEEDQKDALVWQKGKLTKLGALGGKRTEAVAISDSGQIIGWSTTKTGRHHAVLWTLRPTD
jgi:probable HAF family extracellular repeat protein